MKQAKLFQNKNANNSIGKIFCQFFCNFNFSFSWGFAVQGIQTDAVWVWLVFWGSSAICKFFRELEDFALFFLLRYKFMLFLDCFKSFKFLLVKLRKALSLQELCLSLVKVVNIWERARNIQKEFPLFLGHKSWNYIILNGFLLVFFWGTIYVIFF